jgi:predicted transposase YdaD
MEERGLERGLNRGRQEGELKKAHQWLIEILEMRFSPISPELTQKIQDISNLEQLNQLFQRAIVSNSLEEFLEGANLLDSHP